MLIAVLTAMQKEHDAIGVLLSDVRTETHGRFTYTCGRLASSAVVLRQCGIGKVNAAVGTAELIRTYHPSAVISTGVAGGLTEGVGVMETVVSSCLVQHDFDLTPLGAPRGQIDDLPRFFEADARLLSKVPANTHIGLIASGDQFIATPQQREEILTHFPEALAADMESAAIAQACYLYGVPFISFRTLSDAPGAESHTLQYEHFWETLAERSFETTRQFLLSL